MNKSISTVTVTVFLVLLTTMSTAFWIIPDRPFSAKENRALQAFPTLTAEGWLSGELTSRMNRYFNDQLPLRGELLEMDALISLAEGRGESHGVLVSRDGRLAVRRFDAYLGRTARAEDTDGYSPSHVEGELIALGTELHRATVPATVLLPPRTVDVTASSFGYPTEISERLHRLISDTATREHIPYVDLYAPLTAMHQGGEEVYFRTDHHWTTLGAYTAYAAMMEAMGMGADTLPPDAFTVRCISDFYGTTHARAGLSRVPADTLEIWECPDDHAYLIRDEQDHTVMQGFINEDRLIGRDKYAAFLDGNRRLITVTRDTEADGTSRPRLLVAKDSFANNMIPFLARHFDLVVVNLSAGMNRLSELAEAYQCDRILVVYNWENLITADHLSYGRP